MVETTVREGEANVTTDLVACPHCAGTGKVKATTAVVPYGTWKQRLELAKTAKPGDRWIQIKSGRIAVVTKNDGNTAYGSIYLKHENGRTTGKWRHYFGQEFTPEAPPA